MEDELDEIAEGKRTYEKTLKDFYGPFSREVASKEDIEKQTNLGDAPAEFPCPVCGKPMVVKLGKSGKFLSCSDFPKCTGSRLIDGSEVKPEDPIGQHPETNENIYVLNGKFGPYVQQGETPDKKDKKAARPRRASLPKGKKFDEVTLEDALRYLTLPRELGVNPKSGEMVIANIGRFGPYIGHAGDFRSLKPKDGDDPYTITLERALEILKKPKGTRKGEKLVREIGPHPKTKKMISVYESKSGRYFKRGFKRIMLPPETDVEKMTVEEAVELMK
jgi:DNA topoisomerase-1